MALTKEQIERILTDKYPAGRFASMAGVRGANDSMRELCDLALKGLSARPEGNALTQNDKRWRLLEHGCQWVSWCPTGGQTVSFDPRNVTGWAGDLIDMREQADIEVRKQLAVLEEEIQAAQSEIAVPKCACYANAPQCAEEACRVAGVCQRPTSLTVP